MMIKKITIIITILAIICPWSSQFASADSNPGQYMKREHQ